MSDRKRDPIEEIEIITNAIKQKHPQIAMLALLYIMGTRKFGMTKHEHMESDFSESIKALENKDGMTLCALMADCLLAITIHHQLDRDGFIAVPLAMPAADLIDVLFDKPKTEA